MKIFIFVIAAFAVSFRSPVQAGVHLLGQKECTWGPSYWCRNLTSAASCHASKHCIQTDWIHRKLPPDTSSICQTCLDMVKEARDNLLSNGTQDLIKQVFEGTCALVHYKPVVEECDKIVDNFIPDLIDTLASEINPQVVCSVAGLCNNEKYLQSEKSALETRSSTPTDQCTGCRTVVKIMEKRFDSMSKDNVLQGMLMMCRETSSFSDACSNLILTYFTEIYGQLKAHLNPDEVCVLSGQCSAMFHTHDEPHRKNIEVTVNSHIGYVPVDDPSLPCELCEQLVQHLKELMTANTTEEEFKKVMEGLCKQTKSFASECTAMVDEYYEAAYAFLTGELNGTVLCGMIGICPGATLKQVPIVPLLPVDTVLEISPRPATKLARVPLKSTLQGHSVEIMSSPEDMQLPIDTLASPLDRIVFNKELCQFCHFFLNYIQQEISSEHTEEEIKNIVDKACEKLPNSLSNTCEKFVETYEPALVALLAQEIDPAEICPLIHACPDAKSQKDIEIFMEAKSSSDNSKCPLCLFAVTKLEEMVKDKKTEDEIKHALDNLCGELPKSLAGECQSFVDNYTQQLIDMLLADLNPKEMCVYLKLCTDSKPAPSLLQPVETVAQPETNEILDTTYNGFEIQAAKSVECVFCKFLMGELWRLLENNRTEANILEALDKVCAIVPDNVEHDCVQFIEQNGNTVFELLKIVTEPSEICPMMQLCGSRHLDEIKLGLFDCSICEAAVWMMEKILANPKVDHEMKHVLEKTCRALPSRDQAKCRQIIETYGTEIFDMIERMANRSFICRTIGICAAGNKVVIV